MAISETINLDIDTSKLDRDLKKAQSSLSGLKTAANGFSSAIRNAQKEVDKLQKKLESNKKKMVELKMQAEKLKIAISNAAKVNMNPLQIQLKKVKGEIQGIIKTSSAMKVRMRSLESSLRQVGATSRNASESLRSIGNASMSGISKLSKVISGIGTGSKGAASGLRSIAKAGLNDMFSDKPVGILNKLGASVGQLVKRVAGMKIFEMFSAAGRYISNAFMANQNFASSLNAIKVNLATAFQPIYQAVLPAVNTLMSVFAKLISYVATFTSMLFGKTFSSSKQAASGLQSASKAMTGYGEAAEEAKGQVASFDKFNDITPQTSKSAAGAGGAGGTGLAVGGMDFGAVEASGNLGKLETIFGNISSKLDPLKSSLAGLRGELQRLGGFAWDGLKGFYDGFLQPVASWSLGEGLPKFVEIITSGLSQINWQSLNGAFAELWKVLSPFAIAVGSGLLWFFENVLVPLGVWTINEAVPAFLKILASAITLISSVIEVLKPGALFLWNNFLQPIASWTGGKIIETLNLLGDTFNKVAQWISENGNTINTIFTNIGEIFSSVWSNVIQPVLSTLWSNFQVVFGGILSFLINIASEGFNSLSRLVDYIKGAFTGDLVLAMKGIANFFTGICNSILTVFEKLLNFIASGINRLIVSGLNKLLALGDNIGLSLRVPNIPKVVLPRLQALAKGGIAYGETAAIVGDNFNARQNPEVISPLSNLQQMITAAVLQRDISSGNSGKIELKMVLEDGTSLVEALIDPANQTARNLGYAPVFRPV